MREDTTDGSKQVNEGQTEGRWQVVQRRGRQRSVTQKKEEPLTFFFRNFPEDCSERQLRRKFEEVGKVEDVFIPAKRDKSGHKFGFVRFSAGGEINDILEKLNKVWIGSFVIRAFIPRFPHPSVREKGRKVVNWIRGRQERVGDIVNKNKREEKEGIASYAEILKGDPTVARSVSQVKVGKRDLEFHTSEDERRWLAGALTGKLKDDFLWKFHGEAIQLECYRKLSVSDMGERMVLLRSETDKSVEEMIHSMKEWEDHWLEWWRPWKSRDVNQRS